MQTFGAELSIIWVDEIDDVTSLFIVGNFIEVWQVL